MRFPSDYYNVTFRGICTYYRRHFSRAGSGRNLMKVFTCKGVFAVDGIVATYENVHVADSAKLCIYDLNPLTAAHRVGGFIRDTWRRKTSFPDHIFRHWNPYFHRIRFLSSRPLQTSYSLGSTVLYSGSRLTYHSAQIATPSKLSSAKRFFVKNIVAAPLDDDNRQLRVAHSAENDRENRLPKKRFVSGLRRNFTLATLNDYCEL